MRHAWPLSEIRPSLEEPLNIALQYLEQTGQALNYVYVPSLLLNR
jgi:hypothetical protein